MSDLYELDLFDPNPYQPRSAHDPEHIKALASSIAEQGLLQIPVGRLTVEFGIGTRVQLAFGHSRLEAYKFLHDAGNAGFDKMPVSLQKLTDEQMFQLAITENAQRRDLNLIEATRAMKRYRDDFGKNSEQIGQLFGLSESAVRNKLRLLNLPDDVLQRCDSDPVSERVLRELLALYNLPESTRNAVEKDISYWRGDLRPSAIVDFAFTGGTAEQIKNMITRMVETISHSMAASVFKHDEVFEGDYVSPDCKSCPLRIVDDRGVHCTDRHCFDRKQTASKMNYLMGASEVCGIQPIEDVNTAYYDVTTWYGEKELKLVGTGCENLRLVYHDSGDHGIEGFPKAEICCKKGRGQCVCTRAINAGLDLPEPKAEPKPAGKSLMQVFAPDHEISIDPEPEPAPAVITAEQLRQLDREMRSMKRQNLEECRAMQTEMTRAVFLGLNSGNRKIIHWLAGELVSYQKRDALIDAPADELWLAIAERMVYHLFDWSYSEPDPERTLKTYNGILEAAGLDLLESVSVETEVE